MWRRHSAARSQFFADAAAGRLPAYAWVEPNMFFPPLDDYHPPTDIRAGEQFLARVYQAVRDSPQWPQTALIVLFDEHGGCYDHVPPPAAPAPDDYPGQQDFGFGRFGLRVPAIIVSAYTERGTVIEQPFQTCSVLRTLRERFGLGPALSRRDAAAPLLEPAFNRPVPRADRVTVTAAGYRYRPPTREQATAALGDDPGARLLVSKWGQAGRRDLPELGEWMLRNAARRLGEDPGDVPGTVAGAQRWLTARLHTPQWLGPLGWRGAARSRLQCRDVAASH